MLYFGGTLLMSKEDKKPKAKKSEEKAKTTKAKATKEKKEKTTKPTKDKTTQTTKEKKPTKTKEAKPEPKSTTDAKKPSSKPENTIFVGNKSAMTYVLAVMTCFNEKNAKEVRICARGRAISSAVDVAELTRNRFMPDLKVKSIITSTEQVQRREGGGNANVSAIEILLAK